MSKHNSAGASARAEYDKRSTRHKEAARRRRPRLLAFAIALAIIGLALVNLSQLVNVDQLPGGYATLFGWLSLGLAAVTVINAFTTPSHVTAWSTGAEGEERTARLLEPLEGDGFRILHDRKIPGSRANIDHIVVGPPGVFVIESKSYSGRVRVRGHDIYVAGRRTTGWVDEVRREAEATRAALGVELSALGIGVSPILCVHRAELPWFGSTVDGIPIVTGKELVKRLGKAKAVLGLDEVTRLADLAESRLKPAVRVAPDAAEAPASIWNS